MSDEKFENPGADESTTKPKVRRGRPRKVKTSDDAPQTAELFESAPRAEGRQEAPRQEETPTPRIPVSAVDGPASYDWSPSADAKPKSRGRGPRREAPLSAEQIEQYARRQEEVAREIEAEKASEQEDTPSSYSASPDEPAERRQEPSSNDQPTAEGSAPTEGAPAAEGQPQGNAIQGLGRPQQGQWRDRQGDRGGNRWGRNDRFNRNDRGGDRPQGGDRQTDRGNDRGGRYDRFNRQQRGGRNERPQMGGGQGSFLRFEPRGDLRPAQGMAQRAAAALSASPSSAEPTISPERVVEAWPQWEIMGDVQALEAAGRQIAPSGEVFNYTELLALGGLELLERAKQMEIAWEGAPHRERLLVKIFETAVTKGLAIHAEGVVDMVGEQAILVFGAENYRVKAIAPYMPKALMERFAIKRGTTVKVQLHPAREGNRMPIVVQVLSIMGGAPEANLSVTPFEELTPYYPTKRILLETSPEAKWDNFSMRIVDLLTPIGFGQRGLIVAPPRTGKTILMQGMANAIAENHPDAHLMVLLVDERPEEVTDFKRNVKGEVVSSTFDETVHSHVHAAEVVIEKARRMVERGQHVVILLDSITRLARAYNAIMPNNGKIMSGGVESNALQKPKRFFGSARNIENGGSLTILGTALVDTGSKMDEVIFEEFKGTGNMELHLDRGLVDKRLFPAIAMDKSGTRKEELLYHPDETQKVYGLRRAMKGVPPIEAMEMMLVRVKKTRTNIEFLMGLSR